MIILPFMLGWARVLFMATDFLFILSLLTPVEFQSISRDLEQELETEDKSSGEKAGWGWGGESARTEPSDEIYLRCLMVCGHTQGDKYLWEAWGISSVIMEHVNWFCNVFHQCIILTCCVWVRSNLWSWWHSWRIGIRKQWRKVNS